ncbi:ABC transporter permease [Bosea lathyri]|uniref:Peptide/nickel transport system permease protein n=1 Tax=Bosea lathyri TaxID=1036778 RepID=A0A1H6DA20_9HYPH|nr:ABC transporter permease [Bosea lathyri]SEG82058.1 peptide/nickel transport system permease protein [Bosea lathyri]
MLNYLIRRLMSTALVMLLVGLFVFLLLRMSPGDPAAIIAGDTATPEVIAGIRSKLGLNDPLVVQFMRWGWNIVNLELGNSIFSEQPVLTLLGQRLQPTISLSALTLILSISTGVIYGVLAARRPEGLVDKSLTLFSALGFSIPVFVAGYFLVYWFAIGLKWFPVQGYTPIEQDPVRWITQLILPTITLSLSYIALIARITKSSMLEVMSDDYIRTAVAKGVPERTILFTHALKNAGVPVLTVIGLGIAYLISGVVITETVYNIPGIGRLIVDAINNRDYPIIEGVLMLCSGAYVLINLLIDLSYSLIDPRIRY